jgi:hypothetical protein
MILTIAYFVSYVFGSPVQWPVRFASWQVQIHWCWSFWQAGPQKLFPGLHAMQLNGLIELFLFHLNEIWMEWQGEYFLLGCVISSSIATGHSNKVKTMEKLR